MRILGVKPFARFLESKKAQLFPTRSRIVSSVFSDAGARGAASGVVRDFKG